MSTLLTICARGGSKGIPGKNIRPLNGKPLIHYTVAAALAYAKGHPDTVLTLSTDSDAIRASSAAAGLTTKYLRPAALGKDHVGKIDVLRDVLNWEEAHRGMRFDRLIDLDVTSPLRTLEDIEGAVATLDAKADALNIFSVSPPHRNPYFNMVEEQPDGYARVVKRPDTPFLTRQSSPKVYDINGSIYVYRSEFFSSGQTSATTDRSLAYLLDHQCFDLDLPVDFTFMEFLLKRKLLDFPFPFY